MDKPGKPDPEAGTVLVEMSMALSGLDQPWAMLRVSYEPTSLDEITLSLFQQDVDGPSVALPLTKAKRLHAFLGLVIAQEEAAKA